MLDPNKDHSAIERFDLIMLTMAETRVVTPAETCSKGCNTNAYFFRFRLNGSRLEYQQIAWSDIEDPTLWSNEDNAFTDLLGSDMGGHFDVCNLTDDEILVLYDASDHGHYHYKIWNNTTGWGAESAAIIEPIIGYMSYATHKPHCVPYCGYGYTYIYENLPTVNYTVNIHNPYPGTPNGHTYIRGDALISKAFGFSSGCAMSMCYNANEEIRFYYGFEYFIPPNRSAQTNLKWGRAAATDIEYSQAGHTLFLKENAQISQGYNPFFMRTIYNFSALPCAQSPYTDDFWTINGIKYHLTETVLGQISAFQQDWKSFNCTVPELNFTYDPYSTVILRRTFIDTTIQDSNPMLVQLHQTTLYGHTFQCARLVDSPSYAPLLQHLAESQPHLLCTHDLPFCPVMYMPVGSSVFQLLERYKQILSHDTAELKPINNTDPLATLDYELYQQTETPPQQINLLYYSAETNPPGPDSVPPILTTETIDGKLPARIHNLAVLTDALTRTDIVKDMAFSTKRMTCELPPQPFQIGDVVALNNLESAMILDTQETFKPAWWRQTLSLLVANTTYPPVTQYGTVTTKTGTNVGSLTWQHTVTYKPNKLLKVAVSKRAFAGTQVGSITFGGFELTHLETKNQGSGNYSSVEIWYLVNPPVGTFNIILTLASGTDWIQTSATNFYNVKQSSPFGTPATASGSSDPTVTVTAEENDLVIDVIGNQNLSRSCDASQTQLWAASSDGNWCGSGSSKPGAASVTMSWTTATDGFAQIAVAIKAATSAPVVIISFYVDADGNYYISPSGEKYTD